MLDKKYNSSIKKIQGECIVWCGTWKTNNGYGLLSVDGKIKRIHRHVWEIEFGAIEKGLTIDHLCYNKLCINTKHMELVSASVNSSRSRSSIARRNTTHCPQGHEYNEYNTYIDSRGSRYCKQCTKHRTKLWQEEQKQNRRILMATRKLKCKNGLHDMTLDNTRVVNNNRQCIACSRLRSLKWYRKKKYGKISLA